MKISKKAMIAIGVVVFVIGVGGCSTPDSSTPEKAPTSQEVVKEEEKPKEEVKKEEPVIEEKKDYTIGDAIEAKNCKITLNSMEKQSGSNTYFFDILIENTSQQELTSSTLLCYEVTGQDGYKGSIEMFAETKGTLDGTVPVDGKLRGQIAFTMEEGSIPDTVKVNLDLIGNGVTFKLNN